MAPTIQTGGMARVVLITAPNEAVARQLARAMVEQRLVACVNLLPGVSSIYRWEGQVEEESEVLLVVKTAAARLDELARFVLAEHPYDQPEFVALAPEAVESGYLAWLLAESAPPAAD